LDTAQTTHRTSAWELPWWVIAWVSLQFPGVCLKNLKKIIWNVCLTVCTFWLNFVHALQIVKKVILWTPINLSEFLTGKDKLFFCLIFMRFSLIDLHSKLPVINIFLSTYALNVLLHQHSHMRQAVSSTVFSTWDFTKWQIPLQFRSEDWTFASVPSWKGGTFCLLHYSKPRKLPH
jgi:hypothetical protein